MRITLIAVLMAGALATPRFAQDDAAARRLRRHIGLPRRRPGRLGSYRDPRRRQGGILYGVGIGYDFQTGRAVFSIEAEANDSDQ